RNAGGMRGAPLLRWTTGKSAESCVGALGDVDLLGTSGALVVDEFREPLVLLATEALLRRLLGLEEDSLLLDGLPRVNLRAREARRVTAERARGEEPAEVLLTGLQVLEDVLQLMRDDHANAGHPELVL